MQLDKSEIIGAIQAQLAASLEAVERMAEQARDETTGGESKAEGQYDTRSTEASYLARGQAWRIVELRQLAAWFSSFDFGPVFSTVGIGALVEIEGKKTELVLIAPVGGSDVSVGEQRIRVISLASPLGSSMTELETGDAFEVDTPRGVHTYEVRSIR